MPESKKVHTKSKLELTAEVIKASQAADPYYVLSKRERKILTKWVNKQEKERLAELRKTHNATIAQKNTSMSSRRKLKAAIPRTAQQTIPYVADYEEGLFEVEPNKYSKLYAFEDINYVDANQEDQEAIFNLYQSFLSYFPSNMSFAIYIDNRVISLEDQEKAVLYPDKDDIYKEHRREYNRILKQQMIAGNNNIKQSKYISVTIDCDTPYEALMRFHKIDSDVLGLLRKLGAQGTVLSTEERLSLLHDKFRPGQEGKFQIDFDFIQQQGISSKEYIAPSSFTFNKSNYFMIDTDYCRCMHICNLPSSISDRFLTDLVSECTFPLTVAISVVPCEPSKALRMVQKQLTGMEANMIEAEKRAARAGYSTATIKHSLAYAHKNAEALLQDIMSNDQKLFFTTMTVMVRGSTLDELENNTQTVVNKANIHSCSLQTLDYQQEEAFKVTLPVGYSPKHLSVDRTLTTRSLAVFLPFNSQELFQSGGFFYGINQVSRNLIFCNRTAMKTPSGFILGSAGSGKSFAAKQEMLNVLLNDDVTNVIVIDPENEYGDFARAFYGTVIKISPSSNSYINPLDMSSDYGLDEDDSELTPLSEKKEKALKKKHELIMSIVERMVNPSNTYEDSVLTAHQKHVLGEALRDCYKVYLDSNFEPSFIPSLPDLQASLDKRRYDHNNVKDEEICKLADNMEYYTRGMLDVFSHETNVAYDNRFVVFNIRDIGEQLRQIALTIVFDFIWNRMVTNKFKGIRTYCYCDEIHVMFSSYYAARFLQQLYKRGRKYGLVITGITQNVEDLLQSPLAKGMIGNSDFILMLNQAPKDLEILADMLHISESQLTYVSRSREGCGLLFAESVIVPFENRFPKDSYLYKLISTKFGENITNEDIQTYVENAMQEQKALMSEE